MSTPMPEIRNNPQKDTTTAVATKPGRGGLEGMAVGTTTLSKVEEKAGQLLYRGHNIHDLVGTTTFEGGRAFALVWAPARPDGTLPSENAVGGRAHHARTCRATPARLAIDNRTDGCPASSRLALGCHHYQREADP